MRKFIHQLRQKPESHRKRVAYGTSAVFTLILAGVWATSFSYFNAPTSTQAVVAKANTENSPFNVLKTGVASAYEAITGSKVEFVRGDTSGDASGTLQYVPDSQPVATSSTEDTDTNPDTTNGTDAGQTGSQYNF